ncbi:beta-lactamase class A [Thermopolyspora flexuosa]|uniref:Beta-lactamase class A n=1 Tax=Thermopolyspora flexuosa TaxID=103836 RepID=A0A543ITJ3_9ACTN|nr:beta-lactamase class A [Thermopolyspora flexuosa]
MALTALVVGWTFLCGHPPPTPGQGARSAPVAARAAKAATAATPVAYRPSYLLRSWATLTRAGGKTQLRSPPRRQRHALDAARLTRALDRHLAGWPGRLSAAAADLGTGRGFRYHADERMITASTVKVEILMGLLLTAPWRELGAHTRRLADLMIRASDNRATDRLWELLGYAAGLNRVSWAFGLRHTGAVDGRCVDLYCWGVVRTTAADQVRLMRLLATGAGPLAAADRAAVLSLMRRVLPGQRWGVSAGACPGDTVALKNGWLRRIHNHLWVIASVGLISRHGRHYAIAVLSEGSATMADGVARVERVARTIMTALRGGCGPTAGAPVRRAAAGRAVPGGQSAGATSR